MDIVGDQQGWEVALWAPASVIFLAYITLSIGNFVAMLGKMKEARARLISIHRKSSNKTVDEFSDRTIASVELAGISIVPNSRRDKFI
jgi:hypothetical protein